MVNKIVTFSGNEDYYVLDSTDIDGIDYYFLIGVSNDETQVYSNKVMYATLNNKDGDMYFDEVLDPNILEQLIVIFDKKSKEMETSE